VKKARLTPSAAGVIFQMRAQAALQHAEHLALLRCWFDLRDAELSSLSLWCPVLFCCPGANCTGNTTM
jgi:hypothetical protein